MSIFNQTIIEDDFDKWKQDRIEEQNARNYGSGVSYDSISTHTRYVYHEEIATHINKSHVNQHQNASSHSNKTYSDSGYSKSGSDSYSKSEWVNWYTNYAISPNWTKSYGPYSHNASYSNTPHYNTGNQDRYSYYAGYSYYSTLQNAINTGYNKAAWVEPVTYYVVDWTHINHAPQAPSSILSSSSAVLRGKLDIGFIGYDPNTKEGVGTKTTQDKVQYRVSAKCASGKMQSNTWTVVRDWSNADKFLWDTENPLNVTTAPELFSTEGSWIIQLEARDVTDIPGAYTYSTSSQLNFIVEHNSRPTIKITTKDKYMNVVFGPDGVQVVNHDFIEYKAPYWDALKDDEEAGIVVDIISNDPDETRDSIKSKIDLNSGEGVLLNTQEIVLRRVSEGSTEFKGYKFISTSILEKLKGSAESNILYVNVSVSDEQGVNGTTKKTCSKACNHIDCSGNFIIDFEAPNVECEISNADVWKPEKNLTFRMQDVVKLRDMSVTLPDNSVVELSPSELTAMLKVVPVSQNGTYTIKATDVLGNAVTKTLQVSKIDIVQPPTPIVNYRDTPGKVDTAIVTILPLSSGQNLGQSGLKETIYIHNGIKKVYSAPFEAKVGDTLCSYNVSNAGLSSEIIARVTVETADFIVTHGKAVKVLDINCDNGALEDTVSGRVYSTSGLNVVDTNTYWGNYGNYTKSLRVTTGDQVIVSSDLKLTRDKSGKVIVMLKLSDNSKIKTPILSFGGITVSYSDKEIDIAGKKFFLPKVSGSIDGNDGGVSITVEIPKQTGDVGYVYMNGLSVGNFIKTSGDIITSDLIFHKASLDTVRYIDDIKVFEVQDVGNSGIISAVTNMKTTPTVNGVRREVSETLIDRVGDYSFTGLTVNGMSKIRKFTVTNEKPMSFTAIMSPSTEWVGIANKLTLNAFSTYGIKEYQMSVNGKAFKALATNEHQFKDHGIFDVSVKAISNNQISSDTLSLICKIDLKQPEVELIERVDELAGKSVVTITASDLDSGFDYMLLPDGTKVYTPITDYTISSNGSFTFLVFDRAGNKTTKILKYVDLVSDYEIIDFELKTPPKYNSPFSVRVSVKNNEGKGVNVPLELYYIDSLGEKNYLYQDAVTLSKGQTLVKTCEINLEQNIGDVILYAEVNGVRLSSDITPENNVKTLTVSVLKPNYSVNVKEVGDWFKPGQYVNALVEISSENIGHNSSIPVIMKIDDVIIARSYVNISKDTPIQEIKMSGYVPKNIALGQKILGIEVNPDNKAIESKVEDNLFTKSIVVNLPNLGISINDVIIDVNATKYTYPANRDEYKMVLKTSVAEENIKSVSINGSKYEVSKNETDFVLRLTKSETASVVIVVESSCKTETKAYNLQVTRVNDNTDAIIKVFTKDGENEAIYNADTDKYMLSIPTDETTGTLNVVMDDVNAKILSIGDVVVNSNQYTGAIPQIGVNTTVDFVVRVSAEDATVLRDYNVVMTNQNVTPKLEIINKQEIDESLYSLGGILRNNVFIPYGDRITSVDLAKQSGRLNGIVLEVKASDVNQEQFLKGTTKLGEVEYPIRWNSFDGPAVMQARDVKRGYVYIDRSALYEDFSVRDMTISIKDYKTASTGELNLSEAVDTVKISSDITPPEISCVYLEELSIIEVFVADTTSSVSKVEYRTSSDRGTSWSEYKDVVSNSISVDTTGIVYIEIRAIDSVFNESSKLSVVDVGGDSFEVDTGTKVFQSKTRTADYLFINIDKKNSGTLPSSVLNTFK